jgi:hypothetical protein
LKLAITLRLRSPDYPGAGYQRKQQWIAKVVLAKKQGFNTMTSHEGDTAGKFEYPGLERLGCRLPNQVFFRAGIAFRAATA